MRTNIENQAFKIDEKRPSFDKIYAKLSEERNRINSGFILSDKDDLYMYKTNRIANQSIYKTNRIKRNNKTLNLRHKRINPVAFLFAMSIILTLAYIGFGLMSTTAQFTTYNRIKNLHNKTLSLSLHNCNLLASQSNVKIGKIFHTKNNQNTYALTEEDKENGYKGMAVVDANSLNVYMGYNENQQMPMASTTKIITTIIALEKLNNYDAKVVVPEEAVGIPGSSMYLRSGEELTIKSLLYGTILQSGNDSATALAILSCGSMQNFIAEANALFAKLGLENTKLQNAHGLHDDNHYTTPTDLAKISAYALKNPIFKEIVSTKRYTVLPTNKTNECRYYKNKVKLLFDETLQQENITITGIKTGFTDEAGRCIVTSATHENKEYVVVLLNSPDMFTKATELVRAVANKFSYTQILPAHNHISKIQVTNANLEFVNICTKEQFSMVLNEDELKQLKIITNYENTLDGAVKSGTKVGELQILIGDELQFTTDIVTIEETTSTKYKDYLQRIIQKM